MEAASLGAHSNQSTPTDDSYTGHPHRSARSRSYARTHLRTALSLTPYLRPTALQLVAATSATSCSYGGRSTRRRASRSPGFGACVPQRREQ